MSIPIISEIVPQNNGLFPTHVSTYGRGGWHEVATATDRDNIPIERRSPGMACNVISENTIYILASDLFTWAQIVLTGVSEAPLDGRTFVRRSAGWIDLSDILDDGLYA